MALVALFDVVRVAFFADDLLFLDAARRMPVAEVLLGQHGIHPWYRPLSRELYFYAVLLAGPAGRMVAVALSVGAALAAAFSLADIGRSLGSLRLGRAAALLFVTHALTKLLTAWGSGFQDLLSLALVLAAIRLALRGRWFLALAMSFLASLAKETGVIAFALVILAHALRVRRLPGRERLFALGSAVVAVGLVHAFVRSTWKGARSSHAIVTDPSGVWMALVGMAQGFLAPAAAPTALALLAAAIAAAASWKLLHERHEATPIRQPLIALAMAGTAIGIAPLALGNLLGLSQTRTYYAFPALPWVAVLVAGILARFGSRVLRVAVAVVVAWNVHALSYRAPDLDRAPSWFAAESGWREAVRIAAANQRLASDLRSFGPVLPPGTTLLYVRLPVGSFFAQGDGGAATREALGTSLRAYLLGSAPPGLDENRLRLVTFDMDTRHLRLWDRADPGLVLAAAQRLAAGEAAAAALLAGHARPADARHEALRRHVLASSRLWPEGKLALRPVRPTHLDPDSTSIELDRIAAALLPEPDAVLGRAYVEALRHPTTPLVHRALAESLLIRGHALPAALAVRRAMALDGGSAGDHLVLAEILVELGNLESAAIECRKALSRPAPDAVAARARALLEDIRRRAPPVTRGSRW